MSAKEKDIIEYLVCCISEFAKRHNISIQDSYHYLSRFKGLNFLRNHYDIEHTFSIDDAIEDLALICSHNGGEL